MPTLYITEFSDLGRGGDGGPVPVAGAKLRSQTRTLSASSAQSAAFGAGTQFIRLNTDTTCFIEILGTDPTATTSSMRLPADQTEYFAVKAGDKLAAITA